MFFLLSDSKYMAEMAMERVSLEEVNASAARFDAKAVNSLLKKVKKGLKDTDSSDHARIEDIVSCVCSNLVKLEEKRLDEAVRSVPSTLNDVQACQMHFVRAVVSIVAVKTIVSVFYENEHEKAFMVIE